MQQEAHGLFVPVGGGNVQCCAHVVVTGIEVKPAHVGASQRGNIVGMGGEEHADDVLGHLPALGHLAGTGVRLQDLAHLVAFGGEAEAGENTASSRRGRLPRDGAQRRGRAGGPGGEMQQGVVVVEVEPLDHLLRKETVEIGAFVPERRERKDFRRAASVRCHFRFPRLGIEGAVASE